jgi:adenylate cyclase
VLTLIMNPGLPEEQIFPIPRNGVVTVGRTKDNAIFCLHKSLSRKHAQLEVESGRVKVTDLHSKNGVFHHGKRVAVCAVGEGETFRCGDITFLVEGSTIRSPAQTKSMPNAPPHPLDRSAITLQSPLAIVADAKKISVGSTTQQSIASTKPSRDEEEKFKERLFLLIRASELCVSELSIERMLDELVTLAVQVLHVDRIALLALDEQSLQMAPRVIKSFAPGGQYPYSNRVVDWVVDHGSPASFPDVSRDRQLPGDPSADTGIRGAMCVPINPGGGTIGCLYVDSVSKSDCFRPDDLALLRAIANLAAVAIESAALRGGEPRGRSLVPSMRR